MCIRLDTDPQIKRGQVRVYIMNYIPLYKFMFQTVRLDPTDPLYLLFLGVYFSVL